jgi:hypothetical protein
VNGVQWIEGNEVDLAVGRDPVAEIAQVGQISGAPVAIAAKRRQKAVDAGGGILEGGEVALVWSEDPADSFAAGAGAQCKPVVSGGGELCDLGVIERANRLRGVFPFDEYCHWSGLLFDGELRLQVAKGLAETFDERAIGNQAGAIGGGFGGEKCLNLSCIFKVDLLAGE